MKKTYQFTPQERLYFQRLQQSFQNSVASGISMIATQQDLAGQWQISPDGNGLVRVDQIQEDQLIRPPHEVEVTKELNGVA